MKDEFRFTLSASKFAEDGMSADESILYHAVKVEDEDKYKVSWGGISTTTYTTDDVKENVEGGWWVVVGIDSMIEGEKY